MNRGTFVNETLSLDGGVDDMALCRHCQTPFAVQAHQSSFCCHGCEQVYQLLHEQGFEKFYDLRGSQSLAPLRDTHLEDLGQVDWTWLEVAVQEAETTAREQGEVLAKRHFALGGISCVACVWLIEAVLRDAKPRLQVAIFAAKGSITLQWAVGEVDLVAKAKHLANCGYMLRATQGGDSIELDTQDGLGMRTAICAGLSMNAMAFTLPFYHGLSMKGDLANLLALVAGASATGALLVGGTWFFKRAYVSLRAKQVSMDVPIALGLILAYMGSIIGSILGVEGLFYYDFVATFSFLMLLGRWIQHRVVTRHQARMREFDPIPEQVTRMRDGERIVREKLEMGMNFEMRSGLVLPVRAYLNSEKADFALDWINGESEPMVKHRGEVVPAGARLLGRNAMKFQAAEAWADSHVASLLKDDEPMRGASPLPWLEKLLRYYLFVVCAIALAGFGYWWWAGQSFGFSLQVMISVLIVSCPCALGLSIPIADERATALLRRVGVFVKKMEVFGRLAMVQQLVFDKTGTLSLEAPSLIEPEKLNRLSEDALHALNLLIQSSRHPHCLGLREAMAASGKLVLQAADLTVQEVPGKGVYWRDSKDRVWFLGKAQDRSQKVTGFTCEGENLGYFEFEERVRPDAKETLQAFLKRGYEIRILSGDTEARVQRMATYLGIPQASAFSEMSPSDKAAELQKSTKPVLFLGDGANDVLAFKAALCKGTPVAEKTPATQQADFYWQGVGLRAIQDLFAVAKRRRLAIGCAFGFSLLYNVSVVAISLRGSMSPLVAAVVMPISSLITIAIVSAFLHQKPSKG